MGALDGRQLLVVEGSHLHSSSLGNVDTDIGTSQPASTTTTTTRRLRQEFTFFVCVCCVCCVWSVRCVCCVCCVCSVCSVCCVVHPLRVLLCCAGTVAILAQVRGYCPTRNFCVLGYLTVAILFGTLRFISKSQVRSEQWVTPLFPIRCGYWLSCRRGVCASLLFLEPSLDRCLIHLWNLGWCKLGPRMC